MEVGQILDRILEERGKKAELQGNIVESLAGQTKILEEIEKTRAMLTDLSGSDKDLLFGSSKSARCLFGSDPMIKACRDAQEAAMGAVSALKSRYERKTINFVVIGKIGSGKSKFLQTVSGLDDRYIPSFSGSSCTGITSIIENKSAGNSSVAIITFKSAQNVLEDINKEIKTLGHVIYGDRVDQLPLLQSLNKDTMTETFDKMIKSAESLLEHCNDKVHKDSLIQCRNNVITCKDTYVKGIEEWLPYIGLSSGVATEDKASYLGLELYEEKDGIRRYQLRDPDQIIQFVAKHAKEEKIKYTRYIAVEEAVIQAPFLAIDARIRMIDTVGIGDPASDTRQRMQQAIRRESDAVIFILEATERSPSDLNPADQDIPLMRELREVYEDYREANIESWLAFVMNPHKVERNQSESYLKLLQASTAYGAKDDVLHALKYQKVVNVGDADETSAMMSQFLNQIAENLAAVDQRLEENSKHLIQKAENAYQKIRQEAGEAYIVHPNDCVLARISEQMDLKMLEFRKELNAYGNSIKGGVDSLLKERLNLVEKLMNGVATEEIPEDLHTMIAKEIPRSDDFTQIRIQAYGNLHRMIKKIGALPSMDRSSIEKAFKQKIAELFVNCLGINLAMIKDISGQSIVPEAKDEIFFKKVADAFFTNAMTLLLKESFYSLQNFKLDLLDGATKTLFHYYSYKYLSTATAKHLQPYADLLRQKAEEVAYETAQMTEDDPWDVKPKSMSTNANPSKVSAAQSVIDPVQQEYQIDLLKLEMQQSLKQFIEAIRSTFNADGREPYLVDSKDQMQVELQNLLDSMELRNQCNWMLVWEDLYKRGAILEKESKNLRRLAGTADQLNHVLSQF